MRKSIGKWIESELIQRLLFTAIIVGIALAAGAALRYLHLSNQLAANPAARIHDSGAEVVLETKSQAQNLMASDIERRRLVAEQFNMMIIGGIGMALLGLGWLLTDISRSRRRADAAPA